MKSGQFRDIAINLIKRFYNDFGPNGPARWVEAELEQAFKAGREKGLDEAADYIAEYSGVKSDEIKALKEDKEPK